MQLSLLLSAAGLLSLVSGHCLITNAVGDAGGKGTGFGVTTAKDNSQNDVTIFKKGTFGSTNGGGAIDPNKDLAQVQKIAGTTLPQVNKQLDLTLHQINADGAGPMTCQIDTAATGAFKATTIATNVPGNNGRSNAANQDFPLTVNVAAGTTCTGTVGGVKNVCLMKCANPVGPFGGVVAFQMAAAGGAATGAKKAGRMVEVTF